MALTDNCDVFASVAEAAFNKIVENVARQRPSLFNYGTSTFVASPQLMCHDIVTSPNLPANQPRVALEPGIPVPGTNGAWELEYCAQLTKLGIDFHPGQIALPPELHPPLPPQSFALFVEVCGGIACPSPDVLLKLGEAEAANFPPISPQDALPGDGKGHIKGDDKTPRDPPPRDPRPLPVDRDRLHCFCLDVFAIAAFTRNQSNGKPVLAIQLRGLEIVDIKPDGLEDSIECLIKSTIMLGVLPRIRLALDDVILSLGSFGNLQIGFTPISTKVPFNPSVANDRLSVFVDVALV